MENGEHGTSSSAARGSCALLSEEHLRSLDDGELYRRTQWIAGHQNELEAQLIVCLGEIDKRKLYAKKAFSSLFYFCTRVLGLSEDVAMARVTLARAALKHPEVVEALREGRVHLTGLRLLAPHLTRENCNELISRAAGQTKRRIEEIVAGLNPKPDRAPSIRRQRRRRRTSSDAGKTGPHQQSSGVNGAATGPATETDEFVWAPQKGPEHLPLDKEERDANAREEDEWEYPPPRRPRVDPLSEERFLLQVTIGRRLLELLELAEDLESHSIPPGDIAALIERGITLLIDEKLKERFGIGRKPRASNKKSDRNGPASRDIPISIAREVYLRDGGTCAFVDDEGRRCNERRFLQLHHVDGFTFVREHRVDRIELRCSTHNQSEADDMFGREFMDARRQRK